MRKNKKDWVNKMIPIVFIICGLCSLVDGILKKKNPEKLLASKARQRKANLTDEEYIGGVYKSSIFLGITMIFLGVLWIIVIG